MGLNPGPKQWGILFYAKQVANWYLVYLNKIPCRALRYLLLICYADTWPGSTLIFVLFCFQTILERALPTGVLIGKQRDGNGQVGGKRGWDNMWRTSLWISMTYLIVLYAANGWCRFRVEHEFTLQSLGTTALSAVSETTLVSTTSKELGGATML